MLRNILWLVAWLGVGVSVAWAHAGPRIWVGIEKGKVTTYAGPYPPNDPSKYSVSQVFTQPLIDEGEDIWDNDFPGYQKVPGGTIPAGTTFSYNIMGPVLWYNAGDATRYPYFETVAAHFTASPPVPQFVVLNESSQYKYTSTGFVSGDPAFTYNGSSGDHNHLTYLLLGDGENPGGGPDGIYALPLQLTAPGYVPSDTYYLLLGKNVSACDLSTAAAVMSAPHAVPDFDCDGDVDGDDLASFELCWTGAAIPLPPVSPGREYCARLDFDMDDDVDQSDFGVFQRCLSGADVPADVNCSR